MDATRLGVSSVVRAAATGTIAGVLATMAKAKAEQIIQPAAEKAMPPKPGEKAALGADPAGHPENMPPSEIASRAVHAVTGDEPGEKELEKVAAPLHWAMGVGFAVVYAVVGRRVPAVRAGHGLAAGAALFAGTHASVLPATGVQNPPGRLPRAWWVWEGGSHLVYGLALDTSLRAVDAVVDRATG